MSATYEITYEEDVENKLTLHRMSTMPESTHQEAVKNVTHGENETNHQDVGMTKTSWEDSESHIYESPTRRM